MLQTKRNQPVYYLIITQKIFVSLLLIFFKLQYLTKIWFMLKIILNNNIYSPNAVDALSWAKYTVRKYFFLFNLLL